MWSIPAGMYHKDIRVRAWNFRTYDAGCGILPTDLHVFKNGFYTAPFLACPMLQECQGCGKRASNARPQSIPALQFQFSATVGLVGSMVNNVFSLHQFGGADNGTFPIPIKDYQRYLFGDDKLAHAFSTDLAKAFIAHGPGFGAAQPLTTSDQSPTDDVAVAVLSDYVPTATHSLRNHFVAYLNRHLISINARPARKIEIYGAEKSVELRPDPKTSHEHAYCIDSKRLGDRTLIVLADIRTSQDREDQITQSLRHLNINNPVTFTYLVALNEPANVATLSPILSFVVSPSVKDVEIIAQASNFTLNECFVQFVLGRDYIEFCQLIRRQDDRFARLLLDYAIGGQYHDDEDYEENVKFLLWEVGARESM